MKIFISAIAIILLLLISGCVENESKEEKQIDTTKPVITLIGDHSIVFESEDEFDNFVDPGATAIDDIDGNITDKIKVSVIINSVTDSSYSTITYVYDVSDSSGNAAVSKYRDIHVRK